MSSAAIEQVEIRLQLNTRSKPPEAPVDNNTGEVPQFWRGANVAIALGIFDTNGVSVDLSNVAFLEVDVIPMPIPNRRITTNQSYSPYSNNPYPTMPPAPLIKVTIPAADITDNITRAGWFTGTQQNAIAVFDWFQTQQLNLGGDDSRTFWLYVHGITNAGSKITYGGTQLLVFENGAQDVYLPNPSAFSPLDVPESTILYVEPNQQMMFSETISVEGIVIIEGLISQIDSFGSAPTVNSSAITENDGTAITENDGTAITSN